MSVAWGAYGPVLVVCGRQAGRVGYYDDDDRAWAVVYFDKPFVGPCHLLRRAWLMPTDVAPTPVAAFRREHPEVARRLGV